MIKNVVKFCLDTMPQQRWLDLLITNIADILFLALVTLFAIHNTYFYLIK